MPPLSCRYEVEENLRQLFHKIEEPSHADERVVAQAITALAAASKAVLRNEDLPKESALSVLCRIILANMPLSIRFQRLRMMLMKHFDSAWALTPKIEAAQGL